ALCAFMALAAWSAAQAAGASPYDFAPLPTTTIDPDLGYEAKLDLGDRGGASDPNGGVAALVGGCDSIGAFNASFTGSMRYRGNLIRITQNDVILREIKMQLSFTGPVDLYVSIHRRDAQTGAYSRFIANDIILSKDGNGIPEVFATENLINGGNGIALPPGDYAIAFAWGSTSITFAHDGLTYPQTIENGSVRGSVALNLPSGQPPVLDNLGVLQVFTGGAYAMELCFVPVPGACCLGSPNGGCDDRLRSQCTGEGSFFHGQRTLCAETPCEYGACCKDKCGGCADDYTPEACTAVGGRAHWLGAVCPNPSTALCPKVTGACCIADATQPGGFRCDDDKCEVECVNAGGTYHGDGTDCTRNICVGACCVTGGCLNRTQSECTGSSGTYKGNGTLCATAECGGACCKGFTGLDFCDRVSSKTLCEYTPAGFPYIAYRGDGTRCPITTPPNNENCGAPTDYSACCLPGGSCINTTQGFCGSSWVQGGFHSGVQCVDMACAAADRCCFGDGSCQLLNDSTCTARGGSSVAGQTTCTPTACAGFAGACCGCATDACLMQTRTQCEAAGGYYQGDDSDCGVAGTCPGFGGCCRSDGSCFDGFSPDDCLLIEGTYKGPCAPCLEPPFDCDESGACCATTGTCLFVDLATCDEIGGTFHGEGVACAATSCDFGACCQPGGTCSNEVPADACAGPGQSFHGALLCADVQCIPPPPTGACCTSGDCLVQAEALCTSGGGTYKGDNEACGPNTCAPACPATPATALPPNCAIDARQPHAPGDPGALQGWNSVAITFPVGCNVAGAVPGDFTISVTPAGVAPTISNVGVGGQTVTVSLSNVIPVQAWTCIAHTGTGKKVCVGSLPADANGDRTAAPVDILDIIDNLNGVRVPPLAIHQCDLDRSALCAPADILSEIDLLNGASGFLVWNGKTLPICPSAAP
ncbi:MAG: hypothetical protein Q7R41_17465, partial [Phycisphaerales bacterium]|nr:hypothetical protein [Phycisphaerales bacterium]